MDEREGSWETAYSCSFAWSVGSGREIGNGSLTETLKTLHFGVER